MGNYNNATKSEEDEADLAHPIESQIIDHSRMSQAAFDDTPIPKTKAAAYTSDAKKSNKVPNNKTVQKRPFLHRSRSPNKYSTTASGSGAASKNSSGGTGSGNKTTFARSPPAKKINGSNTRSLNKDRTSISSQSTNQINHAGSTKYRLQASSFHKSTPHLTSSNLYDPNDYGGGGGSGLPPSNKLRTPQPQPRRNHEEPAIRRSRSKSRTPQKPSFDDNGLPGAEDSNLINAVPVVSDRLARTPPDEQQKTPMIKQKSFLRKTSKETTPEKEKRSTPERPRREKSFHSTKTPPAAAQDSMEDPPGSAVSATSVDYMGFKQNYSRQTSTAVSTASSVVTVANLNFLPLKTQVTLRSPLDGHNLGPFHKPEEFLERTMENLASNDWESNVIGMAHVVRFARHHSDYLLVEYKPLLQYVMKHVKNLRSQV